MGCIVRMLSSSQSAGLLGYHEYRPERILKVADLIAPFWSLLRLMLWARYGNGD